MIELKPVFDHRFFKFISDQQRVSALLRPLFRCVSTVLSTQVVSVPLALFEKAAALVLALPLPLYSHLMIMLLRPCPGFLGYYLRALYYSWKARKWTGNIIVEEDVVLRNVHNYEIDEFVFFDRGALIACDSIKVGKGSHFAMRCMITGGGDVVIGKHAGLGFYSVIVSATDSFECGHRVCGPMVPDSQRSVRRETTVVGDDAFVPLAVYIMPGVRIGEGAVIAPGSTVRRDIQPWTIWGPERIKKYGMRERVRFDDPEY